MALELWAAAPLLLPVADAARISGVSKSELYRWIASGRLVAHLVGTKRRVHKDDLRRAIEELPRLGE